MFDAAADAVAAAVAAQQALASHAAEDGQVRVRMGMHTGDIEVVGDDYIGLAVHLAARVSSSAHGGQVLLSDAGDRGFDPDPQAARVVAAICRRLDDRFRILVGPGRGGGRQTLEAVVAWSYDLLTGEERALFSA